MVNYCIGRSLVGANLIVRVTRDYFYSYHHHSFAVVLKDKESADFNTKN